MLFGFGIYAVDGWAGLDRPSEVRLLGVTCDKPWRKAEREVGRHPL